jgi:predicted DNA-binding protein (MmcQ/YjbR family)
VLVGADAERFFAPPYLGGRGWVGVRLHGSPDWEEIAALVRRSYRLVAPRRLGALVPE